MNKLVISPAPHIHSGDSIKQNMYTVVIALIPSILVSVCIFGVGAVMTLLISVCSCVLCEYTINKILKSDITIYDGSAILTGLLLGMNLPSNISPWIVVVGSVIAIGVAKMSFGGLGSNVFNPALVGRVFLLIAYPAQMATWPKPQEYMSYLDAQTGATPLGIMKSVLRSTPGISLDRLPTNMDLFLGINISGSLGEISVIAIILGFVYMLWKEVITWHITIVMIFTVFIFGQLMHFVNASMYPDGLFHILSGGVMLGAVFMATDYVSSPMTKKGQIIYAMAIGIITILIRLFGAYPEGVSFAILIMNAFTPLINNYVKPKHFGGK